MCRYMENIGFKPAPIQTDMQKIEQSVKKQREAILDRKGIPRDQQFDTDKQDESEREERKELPSASLSDGLLGRTGLEDESEQD